MQSIATAMPSHVEPSLKNPDERMAMLLKAIALLPEKERLALHAFYLQGQNAEEARALLGLSRSGFYRVLSSACERLRGVLSKREVHP